MTFGAAVQNALVIALPVAVYAAFMRWRRRLAWHEIATRLGLARGTPRAFVLASIACVPLAIVCVFVSSWTRGFEGSMLAPFVGASPSLSVLASITNYGLVATGLPEELLFRGLIAGSLFRRLSVWKANVAQAVFFTLPHLLILLMAPELWPLAIVLPFALGLLAGWLRHTSQSIAPAVIVHAVGNMAGALAVLQW